jgi:two-component system invasion response regulator UvrY
LKPRHDPTPRELEVVLLLASGMSCEDIAETLCISLLTVHSHTKRLRQKLCATNNTASVVIALKRGWIQLENICVGY